MPVFNAILSAPLPVAEQVVAEQIVAAQVEDHLPQFKLDHVSRLTDDVGILQHAIYTVPNRAEGYATDDNARALILMVLLEPEIGAITSMERGQSDWPYRYLAQLEHAFNRENQRFRNFLGYDRRWMEQQGSEDSHGRALWALGTVLGRSANRGLKGAALRLFESSVPTVLDFRSPRACAYSLLGIEEYLRTQPSNRDALRVRVVLARRLLDMYESIRGPEWKWFENVIAYGNARLPQAMLVVGTACADTAMVSAGLESLDWLMKLQREPGAAHFVPIGSQGFYRRGGQKARFDQQPLEAAGAVSACLQAYRTTGDQRWYEEARTAFHWFLGDNDLQVPLYDAETGGCRDGLHPGHVNQNQGAESTLSYLMAAIEMHCSSTTERSLEKSEGR